MLGTGAPASRCDARSSAACVAARSKSAPPAPGGSDSSATYVAGSASELSSCEKRGPLP